ncbi:hypothetical protein DUNSADRAFT_2862 [Dunaliella salina]|uniref:Encoded protein n=1 Tax=Dunaliella salina TaxID=3046 RepID=A0ABQ7FVV6_DUNSA|nr:hypothetical protein DUNSADRAFT_2862 [Dunaliella salina]|eukprot:KAF5826515.1 hypothetical protein DUNSADRAFT_2862 [Dunaliella salina]
MARDPEVHAFKGRVFSLNLASPSLNARVQGLDDVLLLFRKQQDIIKGRLQWWGPYESANAQPSLPDVAGTCDEDVKTALLDASNLSRGMSTWFLGQ